MEDSFGDGTARDSPKSSLSATVKNESVANTFPFEIIEAILLDLSAQDLAIAAANVPCFWREVIEHSKALREIIVDAPFSDIKGPITVKDVLTDATGGKTSLTILDHDSALVPWTCKYNPEVDVLFIHRRACGEEGYIFAPEGLPLRVFDPKSKSVALDALGRFQYKTTTLRDFSGRLLWIEEVVENWEGLRREGRPKRKRVRLSKYSRTFRVEERDREVTLIDEAE